MEVALPSEVSSEKTTAEKPIFVLEVRNSKKFQEVPKVPGASIKWFKGKVNGCFFSKWTDKHKMN